MRLPLRLSTMLREIAQATMRDGDERLDEPIRRRQERVDEPAFKDDVASPGSGKNDIED